MTFQDLDKIPGLSRPWKMCLSNSMTFHNFPGPVATLRRGFVFSLYLTTVTESLLRTVFGSEIQIFAAEHRKARSRVHTGTFLPPVYASLRDGPRSRVVNRALVFDGPLKKICRAMLFANRARQHACMVHNFTLC